MATRSHSRFTDEVYCTPAPSAPEIKVKTLDILRDEIFPSNYYKELRDGLHAAEELKSKELYEKYPPKFKDKNKRIIFDLLNKKNPYSPLPNKSILITRWKPFIPIIESNDSSSSTKVKFLHDLFDYKPDGDDQTIEWYLNFANSDLFAYYSGPLLAQDELQVLECIELCALREYFIQTTNTVGSHTVGSDAHNQKSVPTPTTEEQIKKAFKPVHPYQPVNLIAIEAPSYGQGRYTHDQIKYILTTCYTGFKAAQILANKTRTMNTGNANSNQRRPSRSGANSFHTIIHTGWWGCGAYGNNRQMMLITQILAARWARIDKIIFHLQTNEYQKDVDETEDILDKLSRDKSVDEIINEIYNLNLEWEKSNNT